MCSQYASRSQGASHVHSIQEVLSIMNYYKVFVFAVCKWITGSISRAQYATVVEYYEFFPLVCLMSNYEADEELSKTCVTLLAMMGQAMALPQHVPVVLHSVCKVSNSRPMCWHASCWIVSVR
jgi:proteasome activator subunit 4